MARLGWAYNATDSRDGEWLWLRQVGGQTATMTLQSDMYGDLRMWVPARPGAPCHAPGHGLLNDPGPDQRKVAERHSAG